MEKSLIKKSKVLPWLEVSEIDIVIPNLSEEFNGYKILQVSDIHVVSNGYLTKERFSKVVEIIQSYQVDIKVITGDFVTEWSEKAIDVLSPLQMLNAPDGVYAVLGNHDHWGRPENVRSILKAFNILELENNFHTINRGDKMIHFVGGDVMLNEEKGKYPSASDVEERIKGAIDKVPKEGNAVLLIHEPDFVDLTSRFNRFDLQVSGHSHNGQIRISGFPKFIMQKYILPEYGKKYPYGLYKVNGMWHYTNAGLGACGIQSRHNCPSEISIFTLLKE